MVDEKQDEELDVTSGKASAVIQALHHSVVLKRKVLKKAKLSVFESIFVTIRINGHESWVTPKECDQKCKRPK